VNRKEALARARGILADNNIDDAFLEGEILLRHVLGISRTQLFSDLECGVSPALQNTLERLIERRLHGEPSAYITGHREFYGLDFYVDRNVLIPRPESELLVEKSIDLVRSGGITSVADIGTGCGAIAVSLAVNLPEVVIYAVDVSAPALEVAEVNCRRYGVTDRIRLLHGDMLEPLPGPVNLIIANLPYVRESDLPPGNDLSFEPLLALDGGVGGLDKIAALAGQADDKLLPGGYMLLEIGHGQAEGVKELLRKSSPLSLIEVDRDLAGIERIVSLHLTSAQL